MSADNGNPRKKLKFNLHCKGDSGIIPVDPHLGGELIFNDEGFKDLLDERKTMIKGQKNSVRKIEFSSYNDVTIKASQNFSAGTGDRSIGRILCCSMYAEI